ncbi:hypothetical protein CTI14_59370, partial [Methylobacterium radiotolerans]
MSTPLRSPPTTHTAPGYARSDDAAACGFVDLEDRHRRRVSLECRDDGRAVHSDDDRCACGRTRV